MRAFVLVAAGLFLLGGIVFIAMGIVPPALMLAIWGVLIIVGTVYERVRYKRLASAPPGGSDWTVTDERFIDDESGRPVTVYVQAKTGERQYVVEGQPRPGLR